MQQLPQLLLQGRASCFVFLAIFTLHAATLSFNYDFSVPGDLARANLSYMGDSSNGSDRINLTKLTTWSTGRVAHPQFVRLWDNRTKKASSFTTTFSFAIGGNYSTTRGDGMAFFIGSGSLPSDSGGSYLGLFNHMGESPPTVGVEFDTNRNDGLDPDKVIDHVGIDVNNITSNNTMWLSNLALFGTMWAEIAYSGDEKKMVVTLGLANSSRKTFETAVNLQEAGLPQDAVVGFSAATGDLVESHQVHSWSFESKVILKRPPDGLTWVVDLVVISIAAAVLLACSIAALLCIMRGRKRIPTDPGIVHGLRVEVPRKFSYGELVTATDNFSRSKKLGEGSFGVVYRGDLPGTLRQVAVKKHFWRPERLEETINEFVTEINILSGLRHRNLVKLLGWCNYSHGDTILSHLRQRNLAKLLGWRGDDDDGGDRDRGGLLLVYELIPNGSVDMYLHGPKRTLTWRERYNVVCGIGSAIEYLHTNQTKCVLHRDIKPSNMLLDGSYDAKLGDFGLVRQVYHGQGATAFGTRLYMDPISFATGEATTGSDVYSFGVSMLEIATGRKPTLSNDKDPPINTLVDAVREAYNTNDILAVADERLNREFDEREIREVERVLMVGLTCVLPVNPRRRPSIREVTNMLTFQNPVPVDLLPN